MPRKFYNIYLDILYNKSEGHIMRYCRNNTGRLCYRIDEDKTVTYSRHLGTVLDRYLI